jgi:hypothetical protein
MAAYIALDDSRAEILDNISNTVAVLVRANRAEQQRILSGLPPTLRQ